MKELTNEETEELIKHLQLKVRPKLRQKVIEKLITRVNELRTGALKMTDWVSKMQIVKWMDILESFGLDKWIEPG